MNDIEFIQDKSDTIKCQFGNGEWVVCVLLENNHYLKAQNKLLAICFAKIREMIEAKNGNQENLL